MRNRFDSELEDLKDELIAMGTLCETAIKRATDALRSGERDTARSVISADAEIDQAERDIEHLCLRLLLQQQPVARDLRQISAALKMITDMERIGDQASDIAEIVMQAKEVESTDFPKIMLMAEATQGMVNDSVRAYVKRDLALAGEVIGRDDEVDELFASVREELIHFIMSGATGNLSTPPVGGWNRHRPALEDGETISHEDAQSAIDLIMIAKYLERIGDHATNIAEWVSFSITGVHDNQLDTKMA
ncbi:MAG: phosphate signaling complex protein PhoU [Actinomycetaceae bacterium]|nr:phosphate signaling complex protein PhoU [Actinomycetaceae bacterium]MDY6082260.1 phosphate signaling complex protein PhoU [Actinomycetaceae bacterium]